MFTSQFVGAAMILAFFILFYVIIAKAAGFKLANFVVVAVVLLSAWLIKGLRLFCGG